MNPCAEINIMKTLRINIDLVYPPIPDRRHDYCATVDGYEEDQSLYGYGRSPVQALRDLADHLEEYNDAS